MALEHFVSLSTEFLLAQAISSINRRKSAAKQVISEEEKEKRKAAKQAKKDRILRENQEQMAVINRHRKAFFEKGIELNCLPIPEKPMPKNQRKQLIRENRFGELPINVRRQVVQCRATPDWSDKDKVSAIYAERDRLNKTETDDPYQVDHYYPVMGKTVCGLHVEANLRLIRKSENIAKSNKHPEYD